MPIRVNGKPALPEGDDYDCPVCGKEHMVVRDGYWGLFYGCRDYPSCRGIRDFHNPDQEYWDEDIEPKPPLWGDD